MWKIFGGGLKYYKHKVKSFVGHNTFSYEQAVKLGITDNYIEVPVFNINELLGTKLQKTPDIIDIDTEGLDEEIIISLDTKEFRPKLISIEEVVCGSMSKIMQEKGYVHYVSTLNNGIYIDSRLL